LNSLGFEIGVTAKRAGFDTQATCTTHELCSCLERKLPQSVRQRASDCEISKLTELDLSTIEVRKMVPPHPDQHPRGRGQSGRAAHTHTARLTQFR
jgi:hypothetical protein